MTLIGSAPAREFDPLQSVLAHLPRGMYGAYEALCNFMLVDPTVPAHIKEGLRFLSAVKIGCGYCTTVRAEDEGGARLLPDGFYDRVSAVDPDWNQIAEPGWGPVFQMGVEVLDGGEISPSTMRSLTTSLTDAQIVEALFFMLLVGASHRFSRALGIDASCVIPSSLSAGASTA